ncbi:reticulophagy regulator 3 isoform X2 [Halyomorpha halys]|uniref:reticulophagy regulator 3 isoform X2 n=1 Tax=Halyomorpha halys TaxID=286706 RepID=UPI0006D4D4EF|nr:reticulophagy regulator 3-like isoform X2 [Halyomorpha halys]
MFHYFKSFFAGEHKTEVKIPTPEEELTLRLKPYEKHLYKMQDVLAWKDIHMSIFCIIIVNIIFWFLNYIEWRFLGFFFTFLSIFLIHDAWVHHIWPEIRIEDPTPTDPEETVEIRPEGVLSLPELSRYTREIQVFITYQYQRMKYIRTTQPALFCLCSTVFWLLIAGIGTFLSVMALAYTFVMMLLTLPGVYIHLVSEEQKQVLKQILNSVYFVLIPPDLSTPSSDSSVGDLIPEHDESSNDTVDSFMITDKLERADENSETDSEADVLSFKNTHFNGNSSEEEASLVRDLSFPDIGSYSTHPSGTSGFTSALTGVIYKTFPTISGRLQFRATGEGVLPPPLEEDSDSEFEIIDEDS